MTGAKKQKQTSRAGGMTEKCKLGVQVSAVTWPGTEQRKESRDIWRLDGGMAVHKLKRAESKKKVEAEWTEAQT